MSTVNVWSYLMSPACRFPRLKRTRQKPVASIYNCDKQKTQSLSCIFAESITLLRHLNVTSTSTASNSASGYGFKGHHGAGKYSQHIR